MCSIHLDHNCGSDSALGVYQEVLVGFLCYIEKHNNNIPVSCAYQLWLITGATSVLFYYYSICTQETVCIHSKFKPS